MRGESIKSVIQSFSFDHIEILMFKYMQFNFFPECNKINFYANFKFYILIIFIDSLYILCFQILW